MNIKNPSMFCRQCQETYGNVGCAIRGVCGKPPETSARMDRLIAGLEELATEQKPEPKLGRFVTESLFLTLTNANFDDNRLDRSLADCERRLGHPISRAVPRAFGDPQLDVRSLKELTLFGLKGISAYAHHAQVLGKEDESIYGFIFRALKSFGQDLTVAELVEQVLGAGHAAVKAMKLLDAANTEAYGTPTVTKISLNAGTRPGILVSGHDLRDLEELLEQTKSSHLDVYTHGEMLPAHYYPKLRKYPNLKGNYGDAWHRQQKEFAAFNGAILMTTNCIVPVQDSYRDRIFTTGVAGYPGIPHIPDRQPTRPKDFSAVIARAKQCPPPTPLETGTFTGGFAHAQVLALKDHILDAIKAGKIRKFVVMAGCDGRQAVRDYYTKVATELPADTIILTAGCAKYRYLRQVKDNIDGIPRVLDAGQCNDSYSLALIAIALRDALGLKDVNELPLVFDIAWYEQKAVAVLLALLALGFRNLRLGPTHPAFISEGVAKVLIERFGLKAIGSVAYDIQDMMK